MMRINPALAIIGEKPDANLESTDNVKRGLWKASAGLISNIRYILCSPLITVEA